MIGKLRWAALAVVASALTGCASAQPLDCAWTPTPPVRYLDTPMPSFAESDVDVDPLTDVLSRVRVLEIGNQWPPADAWLDGTPVDQGDGVLRVRTPDCRRERWTSSSACAPSRGRERGRHGGRSRPSRGAHVRAW